MANKISNSLITLSSAAILAIYSAGYFRTSSAADRFEERSAQRRSFVPPTPAMALPAAEAPAMEAGSVAPRNVRSISLETVTTPAVAPITEIASGPAPVPAAAPATEVAPAPGAAVAEPVTAPVIDKPAPPPAPPAAPKMVYRDGTYLGWGYSRHGDIQAFVIIHDGRIQSAGIEKCWTRYSCGWIEHLPSQVVQRQSPDVDYVSGATQSVNAFYGGIVEALAKAK